MNHSAVNRRYLHLLSRFSEGACVCKMRRENAQTTNKGDYKILLYCCTTRLFAYYVKSVLYTYVLYTRLYIARVPRSCYIVKVIRKKRSRSRSTRWKRSRESKREDFRRGILWSFRTCITINAFKYYDRYMRGKTPLIFSDDHAFLL
jgi:uncharacterized protein with von Willebrand factor type A (vWA) domain